MDARTGSRTMERFLGRPKAQIFQNGLKTGWMKQIIKKWRETVEGKENRNKK